MRISDWSSDVCSSDLVMTVKFPVRSVLAEPVISLARLMELKEGDVIPISFGPEVPVMIGTDRFGPGTVGPSNGRAAIRLKDRKSVVSGKSVSVRVALGGRRIIKKHIRPSQKNK